MPDLTNKITEINQEYDMQVESAKAEGTSLEDIDLLVLKRRNAKASLI